MKRLLLITVLFALFNCCNKRTVTYYYYNNIKIERIDDGDEITFIYNSSKNNNSIINAKVSNIDDILAAYLVFKKDEKVLLLREEGDFKYKVKNNNFILIEGDHPLWNYLMNLKSDIPLDSICFISNELSLENEVNHKFGSKVKIVRSE